MDDVFYGTIINIKRRFMLIFSDIEYNQFLQEEEDDFLIQMFVFLVQQLLFLQIVLSELNDVCFQEVLIKDNLSFLYFCIIGINEIMLFKINKVYVDNVKLL